MFKPGDKIKRISSHLLMPVNTVWTVDKMVGDGVLIKENRFEGIYWHSSNFELLLNQHNHGHTLGCDHEFKHYVGITHSYDYCVKCDEKRE